MKILNKSEQFEVKHNSREYIVPQGVSDDFPQEVAYHIQYVAKNWNKDVRVLNTENEIKVAEFEWRKEQEKKELENKPQTSDKSEEKIENK